MEAYPVINIYIQSTLNYIFGPLLSLVSHFFSFPLLKPLIEPNNAVRILLSFPFGTLEFVGSLESSSFSSELMNRYWNNQSIDNSIIILKYIRWVKKNCIWYL